MCDFTKLNIPIEGEERGEGGRGREEMERGEGERRGREGEESELIFLISKNFAETAKQGLN
jgi:hypothetical protein